MTEAQATELLGVVHGLYVAVRVVVGCGFMCMGVLLWLSYAVGRRP